MERIVVLTNRFDREVLLVKFLRDLFPECEISVITIPEGENRRGGEEHALS